MRIEIEHETRYDYEAPVRLGDHLVRLRPRPGPCLAEIAYRVDVDPEPAEHRELPDGDGNRVLALRFEGETGHLRILSRMTVETGDPGCYRPSPATHLARVPTLLTGDSPEGLAGYLDAAPPDPVVAELVGALSDRADGQTLAFLDLLTDWIYREIAREIRHRGGPQSPAETLARRSGACRDQSVLFIAACRAVGLPARFVSGYQDRSAMETDRRYLHAWPEVQLAPGAWHGWDPTRGLRVADGHVPLAAARDQAGTMPVEGSYFGDVGARMAFSLTIRAGI